MDNLLHFTPPIYVKHLKQSTSLLTSELYYWQDCGLHNYWVVKNMNLIYSILRGVHVCCKNKNLWNCFRTSARMLQLLSSLSMCFMLHSYFNHNIMSLDLYCTFPVICAIFFNFKTLATKRSADKYTAELSAVRLCSTGNYTTWSQWEESFITVMTQTAFPVLTWKLISLKNISHIHPLFITLLLFNS